MAQKERVDVALNQRLDELEQAMFLLKVAYQKYFGGIDPLEPIRDRDDARRLVRDLAAATSKASGQRFRLQNLKARWNVLDLWITRNLTMIERGTHPTFKFRAEMNERKREEARKAIGMQTAPRPTVPEPDDEEVAIRDVYNKYLAARRECGQSADLEYDSVRKSLRNQIRQIKGTYNCTSVKFRVTVEDGKARLKAVPQR